MFKLAVAVGLFGASVTGAAAPSNSKCEMEPAYPPPAGTVFPEAIVNLDLAPQDRWATLVKPASPDIKNLLQTIMKFIPAKILNKFQGKCDASAPQEFLDRFPSHYGDEIQGIATATGIDVCDLIIYNIAYEVLGGCTSIVAEDANGQIIHGRNLDFGLGPFNATEMQWQMTDALRPLLTTIHFQRGGKTLYSGVHYLGYVGFLTAVKPGAFSITVDTRFDDNYDHYLIDWLKDRTDTASFLGFLTRDTMDQEADFKSATDRLTSTDMVGPSYVIIGGLKSGEGMVITNSPNTTTSYNVWDIAHGYPANTTTAPWYLLQTNYDHWTSPPVFDNRRDPALSCMNEVGKDKISYESMYNVLHAHPNRNRLTTYTSLMSATEGHIESSKQYCTEKGCVPW